MSKLDLTKPVQTIEGSPVEIFRTDLNNTIPYGNFPVLGVIKTKNRDIPVTWTKEGRNSWVRDDNRFDLINVPEKKIGYAVIDDGGYGFITSDSLSRAYKDDSRYSIIRIEYTVGQKDL